MGRIFEKRKHKIFARNAKNSKAFTRIGREIAVAVKQGGTDPGSNPRLRAAMQNAKGASMPKERVEAAIHRATEKGDGANYEEIVYEGYGPHGVAMMVECTSDNPNRTVANVRMYFSRGGGNFGSAVGFLFERKGFFRIEDTGFNLEELEFELIDVGLEEMAKAEDGLHLYTEFVDYGKMHKALEDKGMNILESSKLRIPTTTVELDEAQEQEFMNLVEKMEEDDDIQVVYYNLK
jgi:YebC/PmpR family DNA-binding regulatory protein